MKILFYNYDRSFKVRGIRETPEGFWELDGVAAIEGPLVYINEDGTKRVEWVTSDVLRDSAPNLEGVPVTDDHPPMHEGQVTPENYKKYTVGHVKKAWFDDTTNELWATLVINDKQAQENIKKGRTELSPGYFSEKSDDVPEGIDADLLQLTRTYNHLALVDEARGGSSVRLHLDSRGIYMNLDGKKHYLPNLDGKDKEEEKESIDESEEEEEKEASDESEEEEDSEEKNYDELKEQYDKLKEQYDKLKGRVDQMKEEKESNQDSVDLETQVPQLVEEYSRVRDVALRCQVQLDSGQSIAAMKKAVVAKVSKQKLNRDDAGYIDGRFEVIAERFPPRDTVDNLSNALAYDGQQDGNRTELEFVDPIAALSPQNKDN